MKTIHFLNAGALLLVMTGCNSPCNNDVVCQTYVHRYGVPLSAQDWSARGQDGCVVSTRRDGVIEARCYDKGVLHGESSYSFPHRDAIEKHEYYDQGQLTRIVENNANGSPAKQTSYNSDGSQTVVAWYDNGSPQAKEEYQNGSLVQGEYYTYNGHSEANVDNQQGIRVSRDSYGQLISKDTIQDGQMVSSTTFHQNGSPAAITPYVNGQAHGSRVTYHPGGEPNSVETWQGGVQHGNTVVYQNGEKYADVPYVNGQKNGVEQRYRDGNEPIEKVSWEADQRHGSSQAYGQTDWYYRGKKVTKVAYDALRNQE